MTATKIKPPTNPNDGFHEVMAIAPNFWGRGSDAKAARAALRKQTSRPVAKYMVVPKGSWVNEFGNRVEWNIDVAGDMHADGACPLCAIN